MKKLRFLCLLCLALCLLMSGCGKKGSSDTPPVFSGSDIHVSAPNENMAYGDTTDTSASDTAADTDADTKDAAETTGEADGTDTLPILSDTPDIAFPDQPDVTPSDSEDDTKDDSPSEETDTGDTVITVTPSDETDVIADIIDLSGILSVDYPVRGQFVSHQSEKLRLLVNYECNMLPTGVVQIDLEVGLESYDINCGARGETGKISVNGEIYTFSTDPLVHEGRTKTVFPFTWHTHQCELFDTSCDIDVSWLYNGSYAGEQIDTLTASAVFKWD